jgi:predicted nucleic acid-binding protein
MMGKVVCNSSCFIALDRINRLDLLRDSFQKIIIPPAVAKEIDLKLDWVAVQSVQNTSVIPILQTQIDAGESEAIALALELVDVFMLLDDKKARRIAKQLDLQVIGTIGLILRAKRIGLLNEVKPILEELQITEFRIRETLYREALRLANEK